MRKHRHLVLLGLIGLLVMTSFPVDVVAQLTLDWSDDFDDGNYDGWTVTAGSFAVNSGKLTVTAMAPGPAFPVILHPSNTTFGNWTFDVEIGEDPEEIEHVIVGFMRDFGGDGVWGGYSDSTFFIEFLWGSIFIGYDTDPDYSFPMNVTWEHHIRVQRTRSEPNTFKVYHNGTLACEAIYIVPPADYSYFGFYGTLGATIDNIDVEYEQEPVPTPTTTEPTTTEEPTTSPSPTNPPDMTMILVIAGGGAAVIVVIAIVLKMRS